MSYKIQIAVWDLNSHGDAVLTWEDYCMVGVAETAFDTASNAAAIVTREFRDVRVRIVKR